MDFAHYVESFQNLYLSAKGESIPSLPKLSSQIRFVPKKILILAPHPDDECLMSGFAVRAQSEWKSEIAVVPFSYGSKKERRDERRVELISALKILGFELIDPRKGTNEELTEAEFRSALRNFKPDTIISTHLQDGHPTHIRSGRMTQKIGGEYSTTNETPVHWLQTEFWQSMENPNLLIPLSPKELIKMGTALMAHAGEVSRNPYHLTLPAWSMDQARRGTEMNVNASGSQATGAEKSEIVFAQIYRLEEF